MYVSFYNQKHVGEAVNRDKTKTKIAEANAV